MRAAAETFRVLIPTTRGLAEVMLLTEEAAEIGRSVACIGGTTETADIAAAYHAFVARPTGVIARLFGDACYRLDVSERIDAGSSWQLGVFAAHALHAAARLALENDAADSILWATGSVRPVDLTIGPVNHVTEKLANSIGRLKQEASAGRRVLVAMPDQNSAAVATALREELQAHGIELIALTDLQPLWDRLGVTRPGTAVAKQAERLPPVRIRGRFRWVAVAALSLCLVGLAAAAFYLAPRFLPAPEPAVVLPPPQQREAEMLVPEMVPFISDRERASIRSVYVSAPDHKAIALSYGSIGFATAQRDEEAAKASAVAACQRAMSEAGERSICELYAVGDTVVFSRGRPPMPPQPWFVRNPAIERPFAVRDVPFLSDNSRLAVVRNYPTRRKTEALAVSERGHYIAYRNQRSPEEAIRRALERCGSNSGVACMILALDDNFVVPIPTLMKVIGVYRPGAITAIAPELRDDVTRRLGNSLTGWNALAVGAGGRVGVMLGGETEQSAIHGAIVDCGRQDRECRVVVLGPFLVERVASPEEKLTSALMAALGSVSPEYTQTGRQDAVRGYLSMKSHKALAIPPGAPTHWRSSEWPSAAGAGEGALEQCQVVYREPCTLIVVDDAVRPRPADGQWKPSDMERVRYVGIFDPERIPGIRPTVRKLANIVGYREAAGPKAAAYHPWGRIFTVVSAESQHGAETTVLAECNADPRRQGQDGPCHLYAIGNQVVSPQRLTVPLTP